MSYPFPGPVPAFNNPPIESQNYQPSVFNISAIALGPTTTVTTTVNHNYVVGQLTRLLIPFLYGSRQLNQQLGEVISIPAANQVMLDINSSKADQFINANTGQLAQIVAVGDYNSGNINSTGRIQENTNILGSFINISNPSTLS